MWEISDELFELLSSMDKQKLLELMLSSIEEMQSYNGQSVTSAIMRSIPGAKEVEVGDGRVKWVTSGDFWKESKDANED
jgi:hypothetical protein